MKITTILPVSRIQYLDRVLDSLLKQTTKIKNLIVIFDGPEGEFVQVRNKIAELDIEEKLCVQTPHGRPASTIPERRWHIVAIHNQIRELLGDCDWVFSVEDDGILPEDALERLIADITSPQIDNSKVGMITGVELGRWGVPYVGAWKVDEISQPKKMTSMENMTADPFLEEIDACGLYCALIRADLYKEHKFDTSNGLGPDVKLGLFMRQKGYNNYIDWHIPLTHLGTWKGLDVEIPATSKSASVSLTFGASANWRQ